MILVKVPETRQSRNHHKENNDLRQVQRRCRLRPRQALRKADVSSYLPCRPRGYARAPSHGHGAEPPSCRVSYRPCNAC